MRKPKFEADRQYLKHQSTMYAMAQKRVMAIQPGIAHGLPYISDETKALFIEVQILCARLKASIYSDYKQWKETSLDQIDTIETPDPRAKADKDAAGEGGGS